MIYSNPIKSICHPERAKRVEGPASAFVVALSNVFLFVIPKGNLLLLRPNKRRTQSRPSPSPLKPRRVPHFLFLLSIALPIVSSPVPTVTLADYQTRLQSLESLVVQCQQAMSPTACASEQVGPDVKVTLPMGPRQIRFGWLRNLLDLVAHPESSNEGQKPQTSESTGPAKNRAAAQPSLKLPPKPLALPQADRTPTMPAPDEAIGIATTPNIFKRLDSARRRLQQDEELAASLTAGNTAANSTAKPDSSPQHKTLAAILVQKEYHAVSEGPTLRDRLLERVADWINTVLSELISAGSQSKWFGLTAEVVFITLLCVALIWLLIRLERQGRFASPSIASGPSPHAASARDWQLWLEDAKQAASRSAWREGIHYLYWASISRLESSGLWPADRARTPREYLALLSQESPKRPDLATLTRSFEQTWYAGAPTSESNYRDAEQLVTNLGAHSSGDSTLRNRRSRSS